MRDRIRRFLEARGTGATSEEIAAYVLKLQGAVADRVVEAAVEGDGQFARDGAGIWTVRPETATKSLREVLFVVPGARPAAPAGQGTRRLGFICGVRVGLSGAEERFPGTSIGPGAAAAHKALASFESFSQGAVPAAFRLPRVRRDLSDWGRVSQEITSRYFGDAGPGLAVEGGDAADLEVLKGWVAQRREEVNLIDMDALGSAREAARVLGDYVRGCDLDGWEKVWRV